MGKNRKALAIAIATVCGLALGSLDQFSRFVPTSESPSVAVADQEPSAIKTEAIETQAMSFAPAEAEDERNSKSPVVRPTHQSVELPETDTIIMSGGLTMLPLREDGVFVGYEIISSGTDDRLTSGDVITSLNGIPVEDSAAGGELLIAALVNPTTEIELRSR